MTDTRTHQMGPNVRRFVRSAWLLLFAQFIAAIFAIGATGWAAFYVADLRAERDALRTQIEEFTGGDVADPVYRDPPADIVETVDEEAVFEEPDDTVEEPPVAPLPTRRPATDRTPGATVQRPLATTSRRVPVRPERPEAEQPAPATQAPPRRNRAYPGGLPGDGGGNAEPPFVPGRYFPEAPGGRVPAIPDVDLDGLVGRPDRRDPVQRPNDPVTDPINRGNQNPNIQRIR
ncbi:hypothetical protein HFP57_15410 [Parasphingopyxis algicola]|uniref:hypothetical protein n=1 Tax=Parasphingopyxis algicola TaxID=2026624 RepID=UPI0015A1EA3E|nr:hypothetical protein [Parasphingopyxis algicola]QLC26280.1 hypothetical protein HFP57_15410 [Parasphingopyxis algicola]